MIPIFTEIEVTESVDQPNSRPKCSGVETSRPLACAGCLKKPLLVMLETSRVKAGNAHALV